MTETRLVWRTSRRVSLSPLSWRIRARSPFSAGVSSRMSTSAWVNCERAAISRPDPSDSTSPSGVKPRAMEGDWICQPLLLRLPILSNYAHLGEPASIRAGGSLLPSLCVFAAIDALCPGRVPSVLMSFKRGSGVTAAISILATIAIFGSQQVPAAAASRLPLRLPLRLRPPSPLRAAIGR